MMRRIYARLMLVVGVLFVSGCSLDDGQNFQLVNLRIIDAEVPESFVVGESYDIIFTYERNNGCVFYEGIQDVDTALTEREFFAVGREMIGGDVSCTQAIEQVEASFRFIVRYDDDYLFRFYSGNDQEGNPIFLDFTIPVVASDNPTN